MPDTSRRVQAGNVACDWCGRAIYRSPDDVTWLAVKGVERGYDPNLCDANPDGFHEPGSVTPGRSPSPLADAVAGLLAEHGYEAVLVEVERQGYTHGSVAAARWHDRQGEPRCAPCRAAWAAYYRDRRVSESARTPSQRDLP